MPDMNWPDLINGAFETVGGLFVFNHARVLWHDKRVAGVSKLSTAIFFGWGVWNLFYYPNLDQWASFAGGLVIVSGNCLWLGMMLWFARHPKPPSWREEAADHLDMLVDSFDRATKIDRKPTFWWKPQI